MRKAILTISFLIGLVEIAYAQRDHLYVNVSGGPFFYSLYENRYVNNEGSYRTGFDLVDYTFNRVGFTIGLNYEVRKWAYNFSVTPSFPQREKLTFNLKYITVPLYFEINTLNFDKSSVDLHLGIEIGFLGSANAYYVFSDGSTKTYSTGQYQPSAFMAKIAGLSYRYYFYQKNYFGIKSLVRYSDEIISDREGFGRGTNLVVDLTFLIGHKFKINSANGS